MTAAGIKSMDAGDPGRIRNVCILAHVDHGKHSLLVSESVI